MGKTNYTPLLGLPAGVLFGLIQQIATPREELEKKKLMEGIKMVGGKGVRDVLSTLPQETQGDLFGRLFTYKPSPIRRLILGERNKTLAWPQVAEKEIPSESTPSPEGKWGGPSEVEKKNVYFTSPPKKRQFVRPGAIDVNTLEQIGEVEQKGKKIRYEGDEQFEVDKTGLEISGTRRKIFKPYKPEKPLSERVLEKGELTKAGEKAKLEVRPPETRADKIARAVETERGKLGVRKEFKPSLEEEAERKKTLTTAGEEAKAPFKKDKPPTFSTEKSMRLEIKQELINTYLRHPELWLTDEERKNKDWGAGDLKVKMLQNRLSRNEVGLEDIIFQLPPKSKARFDEIANNAYEIMKMKKSSPIASIIEELERVKRVAPWAVAKPVGESTTPPQVREKNIPPLTIKYDQEGNRL